MLMFRGQKEDEVHGVYTECTHDINRVLTKNVHVMFYTEHKDF